MKNVIIQVTYFLNGSMVNFFNVILLHVMLCPIWYHLHSLKNVKNTDGGVLLLVKLQPPATLLKVKLLHRCFHVF